MSEDPKWAEQVERQWRTFLTSGELVAERRQRHLFRLLPGFPRCKNCYAPFKGPGSWVVRSVYGKRPSNMNPKLCNVCEEFAKRFQGGAEIELTMLFVDVRGSTSLAERLGPRPFSQLINRFYVTATRIMVGSDALIDKIIGDQAAAMYVPGVAGIGHAKVGIGAAQEIMRATGHDGPGDPWISLGAGVHTGIAFVGAVGTADGITDITVLGDAANTAARLSTVANPGEILVSQGAMQSAGIDATSLEQRELALKGKSEVVTAFVVRSNTSLK
jgi:adenylate cyclase